jgi:ABC-type transporter Mla MlaB component
MADDTHEGPGSCRPDGDAAVDLDVSWLVPADLVAVDALARLHVVAARRGCRLRLHGADGGLAELVRLVGLGDVLNLCPCSRQERG